MIPATDHAVRAPRPTLARDVAAGLTSRPRTLPPKWLYDAAGSDLFEQITRLEEYYPTEAEREILVARSSAIARRSGATTLVELGSGVSDKTTALLDAMAASASGLRRYVGFDVSLDALAAAEDALSARYQGAVIETVLGDFDADLDLLAEHLRRRDRGASTLVAFLGGTIGNYEPAARETFLRSVRTLLGDGDHFLLGTDLVKDAERLVAAYDDRAGVTAAFNRNLLTVLNRELDADFDLDRWHHRAVWDADREWIEMHLVSDGDQVVHLRDVDLRLAFDDGEHIRSEVSAKFRPDGIDGELRAAGMRTVERWTDGRGDYAVTLAVAD